MSEPSPLQILQSNSLSMVVQKEIFDMLVQGEFEMGEKLSEASMATRLGVSRGPVREAFRALADAGLMTLSKNRGVFVKQFTERDICELYEVRIGLDRMVGSLLAPRITDGHLDELRSLMAKMDESLQAGNFGQYFPQNIHFHDRIVEMTGNQKLLSLYRRVTNEMHLLRQRSIVIGKGWLISNREHREIIEALATRDGDKAAAVMGTHGAAGLQRLIEATGKPGESAGNQANMAA